MDKPDDYVWSRPRPEPRRQAPSIERIVGQAVAIADAEGMAAVSMRRVTADLRSSTASLYRYLSNRDELVELMIDAVRAEERPEPTGDGRADLAEVARSQRRNLLRHPWLSAELTGRPALGPNSLRLGDAALAAAAALTADVTLAAQMVGTVLAYVSGSAAAENAEEQARRRTGLTKEQWQHSRGPYIHAVIDSGAYPQVTRNVVDGEEVAADERFEFGLACVLDGIVARAAGNVWITARESTGDSRKDRGDGCAG